MPLKQATSSAVVLVLLLTAGDLFGGSPPATGKPVGRIVIEARYPGANSRMVVDTVSTPIEQQVNGVDNLLHLASRAGNDGSYRLIATFKPGTDLDRALVLVRNRVALALPTLPDAVQRHGVTVRKKAPLLMLVVLSSPDGSRDAHFLSSYANIHIKDELARVAGVGEVAGIGLRDYSVRVWLDLEKLTARNMVASDVVKALQQRNVQIAGDPIGKPPPEREPFSLELKGLGRLANLDELASVILKTDGKETLVRVKDVAHVELGAALTDRYAWLNGKPSVVLGIYPTGGTDPNDLSRALAERLAVHRKRLLRGVHLDTAFDFTPSGESTAKPTRAEHLLIDVQFPDAASLDRKHQAMLQCDQSLRDIAGVKDVLSLTDDPFDLISNHACMVVRLAPAEKRKIGRDEIVRAIRTKLDAVPAVNVRVRDLSRQGGLPPYGHAFDLAVTGPDTAKLHDLAKKTAERLQTEKELTDVWMNQESSPLPFLHLDIDRNKAAALGISLQDIHQTIQVLGGSAYVNDFNRFGRTWQIVVQSNHKVRNRLDDLRIVKVRTNRGKMVPLGAVATVRMSEMPGAIHRLDLKPTIQITANLSLQVSSKQARAHCESLFEQVRKESGLSAEYRLTWISDISAAK